MPKKLKFTPSETSVALSKLSIQQMFDEFIATVSPEGKRPTPGGVHYNETRRAFYAGFDTAIQVVTALGDQDAEIGVERLRAYDEEVKLFQRLLLQNLV